MKQNSTSRANNIIQFPSHRHHEKPWGKYAELHQAFLQTYHPKFYT